MGRKPRTSKPHRKPWLKPQRQNVEEQQDLNAIYDEEGWQGLMDALAGEDLEREMSDKAFLEEYENLKSDEFFVFF
jgi:hypothetical protein